MTDALPLVLTGALTLGSTLLTAGITNNARRKEALAIAAQASAERAAETNRLEKREDALKYQEDYRRIGLSMLTKARRLGDIALQMSQLGMKGSRRTPDPVVEQQRLEAEADVEIEAMFKSFNEMSVYGPTEVADRAKDILWKGIPLRTMAALGSADEEYMRSDVAYDEAIAAFLASLRPYLGIDFTEKKSTS
ncbi:hypothetical protein [Rathayibacter sp. AY1D9]|uniref:hypothetical protein n=1 Tax=Rathayibacter sp. AY1D9 TaxID=2080548 RepID=UPI0011AFF7E4|nr:hypothetical protein [Rathayibacter sp. AY1D9]